MKFNSLEQRILQSYLGTFPPFVPLRAGIPEESQRQMHAFLAEVYRAVRDDPSIWFGSLHEDDAHPNRFNKKSHGKPKLIVEMRKVLKTVDAFLSLLFTLGAAGRVDGDRLVLERPVKVAKKDRALLESVGLRLDGDALSHDRFPGMFPAWDWMAKRPGASVPAFSRCMFDPDHAYSSDIFRCLAGDEKAFDTLDAGLRERGYRRVDARDGGMTWDLVRCMGDPAAPLGNHVFDHNHIGVAAEYEAVVETPQCFALRVDTNKMREIVPLFDEMDDDLKEFVLRYNKKCDRCGYCVMRNRNRTPPPEMFFTTVEHGGEAYDLCPVFPGFNYCWTSLDEKRVTGILAFLSFAESRLSGKPARS